jgi:hypothetical protein
MGLTLIALDVLTVLFADKLIDAVPIVDDIFNVSSHNADQSDRTEERYQSRSYLPMVTVNKGVVNSVLRHFGSKDKHLGRFSK